MADLNRKLMNSESMKNISNVRTPMTPENRVKRIVLLIAGTVLIIAGIIVWAVSCNNQKTYSLGSDAVTEAAAETTAAP